jgi:hypothetical protein
MTVTIYERDMMSRTELQGQLLYAFFFGYLHFGGV